MINHELTQHETSRRDLLAGIGMLGGLAALAACGKKATASRPPEIRPTTPDPTQTPETTPTAQSTWTSTSEPTPTQNGVISRLEQNPNYILDKTKFEDWDNKTLKQKRAVAREWFALNGFTEPIPKYNTGDNSHNDVDELVDWYNRMRYRPVWNLYRQDPAIARHIAEDIIANDSGINNRIATSYPVLLPAAAWQPLLPDTPPDACARKRGNRFPHVSIEGHSPSSPPRLCAGAETAPGSRFCRAFPPVTLAVGR